MSPIRLLRDVAELYRDLARLLVVESTDEDASYEIAVSARRFSRNTQAVVDDKLNFSATLMRAGEVDAANRLLREFEHDVLEEEAALFERVNEVKVAEANRRDTLTRLRLARMLAVAMLGSTLLAFSAAGMAVAGLIRERAQSDQEQVALAREADVVLGSRVAADLPSDARELHRVKIGNVRLVLTGSQLRTIRALAGGSVDESGLQDLIELLPRPLAAKVQQAIAAASSTTDQVQQAAQAEADALKARLKKKARQAEKAAAQEAEAEEPSPEPSPSESEQEEKSSDEREGSGGGSDDEDGGRAAGDDEGQRIPIIDDGDA